LTAAPIEDQGKILWPWDRETRSVSDRHAPAWTYSASARRISGIRRGPGKGQAATNASRCRIKARPLSPGGSLQSRGPGRARGSFVTAQASVSAGRAAIAGRVIVLRRQRLTGKHIAKITAVSAATVSRVLKRAGLRAAELPSLDAPL